MYRPNTLYLHKYSNVIVKRPFGKEWIPSFGKAPKDSDKRKVRYIESQHHLLRVMKMVLNLDI